MGCCLLRSNLKLYVDEVRQDREQGGKDMKRKQGGRKEGHEERIGEEIGGV